MWRDGQLIEVAETPEQIMALHFGKPGQ